MFQQSLHFLSLLLKLNNYNSRKPVEMKLYLYSSLLLQSKFSLNLHTLYVSTSTNIYPDALLYYLFFLHVGLWENRNTE